MTADYEETTEFLILIQQGGGIIIQYRGEMDIAQYWMDYNSDRLEDWDFQKTPDMDGIFLVSAKINYDGSGDVEISSEQWELANTTNIRSFGINIADNKNI